MSTGRKPSRDERLAALVRLFGRVRKYHEHGLIPTAEAVDRMTAIRKEIIALTIDEPDAYSSELKSWLLRN